MRVSARLLRPTLCLTVLAISASAALASSMTYTPVNPNFGGSPLNGGWMLQQNQIQNTEIQRKMQLRDQMKKQTLQPSASGLVQTPGQIFARQLQSQLYSSLANKINQAIFGENAQQSGTFAFEGTTINFNRVGNNIEISINDGQSVTNVTVPAGP
jgi:curli production assembly/transport component CsgF